MCRWRLEGVDAGYYTMGVQNTQRYIEQSLPIDVYVRLMEQKIDNLQRSQVEGVESQDSNEQLMGEQEGAEQEEGEEEGVTREILGGDLGFYIMHVNQK